jgi:hypothetical protein
MKIGYARLSKPNGNEILDLQIDALLQSRKFIKAISITIKLLAQPGP